MTNFNERIAELAALDRRVGYWDWGIDEQWDHHVLYDDGYAFSVCETESADALPTHAAFIVALRNKTLPLLREMQAENERLRELNKLRVLSGQRDQEIVQNALQDSILENKRLRQGLKDVAEKYAEMYDLRDHFYYEMENAQTALLFANRENERLRAGIVAALGDLEAGKEGDAESKLEALQNDE